MHVWNSNNFTPTTQLVIITYENLSVPMSANLQNFSNNITELFKILFILAKYLIKQYPNPFFSPLKIGFL